MHRYIPLVLCLLVCQLTMAQYTYTIKADSVKITNCDSAELIIENHTQGVPGFLYNTGRGRTIFKRALTQLNDSVYLIGADTLKLQNLQSVLNVGHQKNTVYTDTAVVDTFGYTMWNGYPSNYGTSYAPYGKSMNFTQGWERFNGVNTPIVRPNVVGIAWGYNTTPGGGILDTAEQAGFGFRTETFYNLNSSGRGTTEIHWPEFYANHGASTFRPWSYYIDNLTGAVIHQSQIQNFNFNTKNQNKPYYGWSAATSNNDSSISVSQNIALGVGGGAGAGNTFSRIISYADGYNAPLSEVYDRGSYSLALGNGNSYNGYALSFTGAMQITGAPGQGSSYVYLHSATDQETLYTVQLNSSTFNNNPSYIFDRRYNGSTELPDATNAGEMGWQTNAYIRGVTNGTWTQGNCEDIIVHSYDTDDNPYDQLIVGRNGNITVRRSVIAGGAGNFGDSLVLAKVAGGSSSDSILVHNSATKAVHAIAQNAISGLGQYPHIIFTPSSGGIVNLADHQYNIINPSGALSTLTVNLPASPVNNDVVIIKFTCAIASITYSGGTVANGPGSAAAGGMEALTYDSGTATWY
jgi:hypothetical protein